MKELDLVLRAKDEIREAKGKAVLEKQIHSKLTDVLRNHGDEVVFGGTDDYLLKANLNSGELQFLLNVGSETDDVDLPYVHLSFESERVNKTVVFFEKHVACVADASYDVFRKAARMRRGKKEKGLAEINFRLATKEDLLQFAEVTDLLADTVKSRVGEIDPVGFHNRLGIVA